jgi:hypothetical protein
MDMRNKAKLIELAYHASILFAKDLPGEPFHSDYLKHPDLFRRLMKSHRAIDRDMKKYFADFALRLNTHLISWIMYDQKIRTASEIDDWILVDWDEEALKIKVILTAGLQEAIIAGGMLMEFDSKINVGWKANTPTVLDFINRYGLKLAKGLNQTSLDKIKSSLKLSIDNGEILEKAQGRILDIIDDPDRASTIARTESVAAFGSGRRAVAEEIGWGYKEWHTTVAPCAICMGLPLDGRIKIDKLFGGEFMGEPAHPNCRCSVRYFQGEED